MKEISLRKILTSFQGKPALNEEEAIIKELLSSRASESIHLVTAGKTGTGKSTLLNDLFDLKGDDAFPEGVGDSGSKRPETKEIKFEEHKGTLIVTDLPGIGESEEYNERNNDVTLEYLENANVVLWLFQSDDNDKITEQKFFNNLPKKLQEKFILGLSKIDQPINRGHWNDNQNKPSEKILEHIFKRIKAIEDKIDIPNKKIIEFSTYKKYNLELLKKAMLITMKSKSDILENQLSIELQA